MGVTYEEATGNRPQQPPKVAKAVTYEEATAPFSQQKNPDNMSFGEDLARSAGSGLLGGTAGLADFASLINPLPQYTEDGIRLGPLTFTGNSVGISMPTSATDMAEDVTGGGVSYEPKHKASEYVKTGASFLPNLVGGEGNLVRRGITDVALPAIASQFAGDQFKGTALEPIARVGGALVGGVGGAGAAAVLGRKAAREAEVGRTILGSASERDPASLISKVKTADEIIPGSKPKLAESVDDIGLSNLEQRQSNVSPNDLKSRIRQRGEEQNMARRAVTDTLDPPSANPLSAADEITSRLDIAKSTGESAIQNAKNIAIAKTSALPVGRDAQDVGSSIRTAVLDKKAAAKSAVNDLYKNVNPSGDLNLVARPIKDAADEIKLGFVPESAPMTSSEKRIFDIATNMSETNGLHNIAEFKKNINKAIAEEIKAVGDTSPTVFRLNKLRSAVEDTLENAFANQQKWKIPAGYSGPQPNMTPGASRRLDAANSAYREYASTYRSNPVSKAVASAGYQPAKLDSSLPGLAFKAGPTGKQTAEAFLKASENSPESISALKESAINTLSPKIKDGILDAKTVASWKSKHKGALEAIDAVDPTFMRSIDEAAASSHSLESISVAAKEAEKDAVIGYAQKLLGVESNDRVKEVVFSALSGQDGAKKIKDLVAAVSGNATALNGLKAAGARRLIEQFTNMSGQIRGSELVGFVSKHKDALEELFGPQGYSSLSKVSDDIARSTKAFENTKVPIGSSTASQVVGPMDALRNFGESAAGTLSRAGTNMLSFIGLPGATATTAALGVGLKTIAGVLNFMSIRNGLKFQSLLEDAIMDPKLAAQLMEKAVVDGKPTTAFQKLAKLLMVSVNDNMVRSGRKSGGRVGIDHTAEADNLIAAAEESRQKQSMATETLLNQPDDSIVKALDVANRSI